MRIVLAYSGSLEGSAAIPWLRERHDAQIVAVTLDLGQGRELEAVRDRALALGAQRAHVLDARDEFAQQYVTPALRADALHEGGVPMALALSRPLIAAVLVDIARIERADAVAHTGRRTADASPLDRLLAALAPTLPVLTPARTWTLGPDDLARFARTNGLGASTDAAGRVESNFWGRSRRQASPRAGDLAPTAPATSSTESAVVDITFTRGVPTALNGVVLPLAELVGSLGTLALRHGVGQTRTTGLHCEAPAAVLLHAAHRALARAAASDDLEQFSRMATAAFVAVVEQSRWFSPLREALDAYFAAAQARVHGHVRMRLSQGAFSTISTELAPPAEASLRHLVPSSTQH
jgi:argininosuccinate synthase